MGNTEPIREFFLFCTIFTYICIRDVGNTALLLLMWFQCLGCVVVYRKKIRVVEVRNVICSDRILTIRIRNIYSPANVGIGCYKAVNYQPGS